MHLFDMDLEITNTKAFLLGQLEAYKYRFANTSNNKYLEVMHKLNETIELIERMENELLLRSKYIKYLHGLRKNKYLLTTKRCPDGEVFTLERIKLENNNLYFELVDDNGEKMKDKNGNTYFLAETIEKKVIKPNADF